MPQYTALVTLLAVAFYFVTIGRVGAARGRTGVAAPAVTGNPEFERAYRVQMNTLESMPMMLPSLWLFALYVSDVWAAVLGVVWIVGRIMYMVGYSKAANLRGPGFGVQFAAIVVLWVGAMAALVSILARGH